MLVEEMNTTNVELARYDDCEFILIVDTRQVGPVLTNAEARLIKQQLQDKTFDLAAFIQRAGVV